MKFFLKKKKFNKIKLMGNLRFNFFQKKVFKDELKLKNITLDIDFEKNVSKFYSIEFYDFLTKFNSLTFDQIIFQFKKLISKIFIFNKKKI